MTGWFKTLMEILDQPAERPESFVPAETQVVCEQSEDAVIGNVRIAQEGSWLVFRCANPLGSIHAPGSFTSGSMGEPEYGCDDLGAFMRWPITKDGLLLDHG